MPHFLLFETEKEPKMKFIDFWAFQNFKQITITWQNHLSHAFWGISNYSPYDHWRKVNDHYFKIDNPLFEVYDSQFTFSNDRILNLCLILLVLVMWLKLRGSCFLVEKRLCRRSISMFLTSSLRITWEFRFLVGLFTLRWYCFFVGICEEVNLEKSKSSHRKPRLKSNINVM